MTPQLHQELSAYLGLISELFKHGPGTESGFNLETNIGDCIRKEAQRLLRRIEKDEKEAILGVELDEILKDAESVEVSEI